MWFFYLHSRKSVIIYAKRRCKNLCKCFLGFLYEAAISSLNEYVKSITEYAQERKDRFPWPLKWEQLLDFLKLKKIYIHNIYFSHE